MSQRHHIGSAQAGLDPASRLVKLQLSDGLRWVTHEMSPAMAREFARDVTRCADAAEADRPSSGVSCWWSDARSRRAGRFMIPEEVLTRRGEPVIVNDEGMERDGTIEFGDASTRLISVYCERGGRVIVRDMRILRCDPGGKRPVWAEIEARMQAAKALSAGDSLNKEHVGLLGQLKKLEVELDWLRRATVAAAGPQLGEIHSHWSSAYERLGACVARATIEATRLPYHELVPDCAALHPSEPDVKCQRHIAHLGKHAGNDRSGDTHEWGGDR